MTEYSSHLSMACIHVGLECLYLHFQFVHEEALACELAAYFYLEIGETNKAVEYCLLAHEKYQEWVSISC